MAYKLEMLGLRTVHVDLPGDDLWCSHPSGELLRVQVKSSRAPYARKDRVTPVPTYNFKIVRKTPYDGIYVFVVPDLNLMIARRWDDTPPQSLKILPRQFTLAAQNESIRTEFKL